MKDEGIQTYLKTVATFCLLANHIQDGIYELSTLCVVTLGPIISSSTLSEDKVVWSENLTEWSGADRVHCARLQVDQYGTGDIFATGGFIEVHIDSLQLQVGVTVVCAGGVNTMLVRDYLPELLRK